LLKTTFGEFVMNRSSKVFAIVLIAATAPWLVAPSAAAPLSSPLALQNAVAPSVETVQYRRGWRGGYRGGGFGGVGLGLAAGAIIGGAVLGAGRPYGYDGYPGYAYGPVYEQGYVAPSPYAGGSEVAYCEQRFRSYDPASGTYLGLDGRRHSCP
jgi:BA14K-like protein